jgi:predicted Fe-Mo cluster-binding NifX family protein
MDAMVDPRFGRSPFFTVVDLETMTSESVPNEGVSASSGAGIQAAQMVARLGASVLITGSTGPNAYATLSAAGIEVYQSAGGNVREAVERFKRGELQKMNSANSPAHAGMGQGNPGAGMSGGRGGGRGRDGGMGRGPGGRGQGGRGGW